MAETEGRLIFKVQISLASSDGQSWVLTYDKNKKYMGQFEPPKDLIALMKGRAKVFFYGSIVNTKIRLEEEAPWQNW